MQTVLLVVMSYILGMLPAAYITGRRIKGIDVYHIGDNNPGASNVYRHVGHVAGFMVLGIDIGKGAAAVVLARVFSSEPVAMLCGLGVVAGHNWPVLFHFKGGRGLSTSIGVLWALVPIPMAVGSGIGIVSLWMRQNLLRTGVFTFVPMLAVAWLVGVSVSLMLYSVGLLCISGLMHLLSTRHLSPEQKQESLRWA